MATKRLRKAAEPAVLVRSRPTVTADTIVELIENGNLDKSLRRIVRACFYRREALYGDAHVMPDPPTAQEKSRSPLPPVNKTGRVTTRRVNAAVSTPHPALTDLPAMFDWFQSYGEEIKPHSIRPRPSATGSIGNVTYNNQKYRKADFLAKKVRVSANTDPQLSGLLCGIVGIGSTHVKLIIVEEPISGPTSGVHVPLWTDWKEHNARFVPIPRLLRNLADPVDIA